MESILNFNIDTIYTVIYKKEPPCFRFDNSGRDWDGFVLFTEGNAVFISRDGQRISCTRGTLLLLRRSTVYSIFSREGCGYITSAFDFSPYCSEALRGLPAVVQCTEKQYNDVVQLEKKWQLQQWDSQLFCRIGLLELYGELLRSHIQPERGKVDGLVGAAIDYIHRHFKENFSANAVKVLGWIIFALELLLTQINHSYP